MTAVMNWDNLKVFLEISRAGSLTAAAHRLGIDQSTAGRRLNALEAELGAILFVRSKAGFVPTERGKAALIRAQEMERSCDALQDDIASPADGAFGRIRIVANGWMLRRLAETSLPPLLQKNPGMEVHLESTPPPNVIRGDATISLWFERPPNPTEFTIELGKIPYAVYGSTNPDAPADTWVHFLDEVADRPQISSNTRAAMAENDRIQLTATDADLLLGGVRGGIGKGLLPMCIAHSAGGVQRISKGAPDLMRPLFMHLNPDTVETRRVQETMGWLRETFSLTFGKPT